MSLGAAVKHQDRLLTINIHKDGEIKNALPGVHISPCYLDQEAAIWVVYARFDPGTQLPRHFHTGPVHFFTTAGSWYYVEYPDDVQTAGSYLYEPGGSIHTLRSDEGAEGFITVYGSNVNLNDDDSLMFIMEAGWIENVLYEVAKETGQKVPRFIKPTGPAGFSDQTG